MNPHQFIEEIIKAYREARKSIVLNEKIKRGRSRSISSVAEDLFANYLISNDKNIDIIYVDQPIHIRKLGKTIYPDITVVKNEIITSFLDLKMDLGWHRKELVELCKTHGKTIKGCSGELCRLTDNKTKPKIVKSLKISGNVNYSIVIISKRNSGTKLDEQIEVAKQVQPDVNIHVLCRNPRKHPNDYNSDLKPKELVKLLDIDLKAFNFYTD